MAKRAKLKGVAERPVFPALPPVPCFVTVADDLRLRMMRNLFKMSDDELLKSAGLPTGDGYTAPTLRLAAGGGR